jgi:DNA-binding MarR family transcriptional regulator
MLDGEDSPDSIAPNYLLRTFGILTPGMEYLERVLMKRLPYDHRDRTLSILASKGGIITLTELRRSMEIRRENLERILHELGAEGRIVRSTGKQGIESISLVKSW